jgi:antitoxin CcdA
MTDQRPLPRRKPTNLTLETDLVAEARRLGLNLSRAAEDGLRRAIAVEAARRWREENAEGIRQMNAYVERHGLPLAKYRMF